MDLGLGFDDDDFQSKQKTTTGAKTSYNAKVCQPLWFESEELEEDPDPSKYIQQLLYSADYHFYHGNYETAASKYTALLGIIPKSKMVMILDVQESLCRSYTKLNKHQDSTAIAQSMVAAMRGEDEAKQRQSLLLLSRACRGAQDWTGCILALEELVSSQTQFPPFWLDLGRAYRQSARRSSGEESGEGDCGRLLPQIVTCYLRARMLLQSVVGNVGPIARQKTEAALCSVEVEMTELAVSQELTARAAQALRLKADIEADSATAEEEAESDSLEKTPAFSSEVFRKRWFSWAENLENT